MKEKSQPRDEKGKERGEKDGKLERTKSEGKHRDGNEKSNKRVEKES